MPCKRHRTCPCLLQATPEHPFYILNDDGTRSHDELGQGWIRAKDLKAGDIILLLDGTQARIESVESEQLDKPVKVYNFEVEDYHTYFVGRDGWLVHNVCTSYGLLRSIAKTDMRSSISYADAMAYCDLAAEYGVDYHLPMTHPGRAGYWSSIYHIKVAGIHIRVNQLN